MSIQPLITVFTPTYNRAHLLPKLFESLQNQTRQNFEWIIVDDGSTDNTSEVVDTFLQQSVFKITYQKESNGGKHRALNKGIQELADPALPYFFIVDSDDYLPTDACEWIEQKFEELAKCEYDKSTKFVGISGIRLDQKGQLHGSTFDNSLEYIDSTSVERPKHGIFGDKAEVFYLDVLKQYIFPEFVDGSGSNTKIERFLTEAVVFNRMSKDNLLIRYFNKPIYIAEYLEEGLTKSGWGKFFDSPGGTALYAKEFAKMGKWRGSLATKLLWLVAWPVFTIIAKFKRSHQTNLTSSR
jgi:glycosyltransferase involved in cell wall biosynthesis